MKNKARKIKILAFPRSNFGERDVEIFKELGYDTYLGDKMIRGLLFSLLSLDLSSARRYLADICISFLRSDVIFAWWAFFTDIILLSKIIRKPYIIVAGGGDIEILKNIPKEYKTYSNFSAFRKLMIKITLKFADKVISVSNYAKDSADKIVKNPTNEVVYNTVDTDIFKPLNVARSPYIVTVGRISLYRLKRKGALELVEAFSKVIGKHPEYRLIYMGDEFEALGGKRIIRKRAEELGVEDKVIFRAFSETEEEYVKFLNQCKIYVQYSTNECFGVAMCEAMACGVPVIASNRTALPEVVSGAGLIADRDNIDDLVEKIEMLINDENLYNGLSAKAIERVRNNFSKEIRKRQLKRIIEEIVK